VEKKRRAIYLAADKWPRIGNQAAINVVSDRTMYFAHVAETSTRVSPTDTNRAVAMDDAKQAINTHERVSVCERDR
jgi:hypothetical protein